MAPLLVVRASATAAPTHIGILLAGRGPTSATLRRSCDEGFEKVRSELDLVVRVHCTLPLGLVVCDFGARCL